MATGRFDSAARVSDSVGTLRGRRLTFSPRYDGFVYDASRFTEVHNGWAGMTKPHGGFWLSVDGSWERWCETEEPGWISHGTYEVEVADDARVYSIASMSDISPLPKRETVTPECDKLWSGVSRMGAPIDFKAMSEIYDGVSVDFSNGDSELWRAMYGWDCDSVLLFSADVILDFHELN